MEIIKISNLSYAYDDNSGVISNLSLSIEKGEYVSLVGHNGSGKSTLAKLIIGLLFPTSGSITVEGLILNNENIREIRKHVCLVFQNPDNQFIGATVEDDIAFGLENRQVPHDNMKNIILEYAKKVGMDKYLTKEPNALSGGQKQRVAIAGALALNPDILILDEATSMLDPRGKREILNLIQVLRNNNKDLTVISITHDVEEAYHSDKVLLLNKGSVVASGKPDDIFNDEELLKENHLEMPFLLKAKKELAKNGISKEFSNIEELEEILCQLK